MYSKVAMRFSIPCECFDENTSRAPPLRSRGHAPMRARRKTPSPPAPVYTRPTTKTALPTSNHHLALLFTHKKRMPPPQVVVCTNHGKEIGGGNHYCIICRTPAPATPPGKLNKPSSHDPI
ncbi:hypothetical protein ACFYE2_17975, partial [Kocuria sp. CPCC 205300]|uniref:hypothetical protein n=1 Tax=Kocuria sabuli TaxID=3071448 RepID=UPI0036DEA7B4